MKKSIIVVLMLVFSIQFAFAATTSFEVTSWAGKNANLEFYDSSGGIDTVYSYDDSTEDGTFSFEVDSGVDKFEINAFITGENFNIKSNFEGVKSGKDYCMTLFENEKDISKKEGDSCIESGDSTGSTNTSNSTSSNGTSQNTSSTNSSEENSTSSSGNNGQENSSTSTEQNTAENQTAEFGQAITGLFASGGNEGGNSFFRIAFYVLIAIVALWVILYVFKKVVDKKEKEPKKKQVKVTKLSDLKSGLEQDRQKFAEQKQNINQSIKDAEEKIEKAQEAIYNLRKSKGIDKDSDSKSDSDED